MALLGGWLLYLGLIVGFYDWRKLRNREGVSIGQVRRVAIDGVISSERVRGSSSTRASSPLSLMA
jgi:hypothetical protein